MALSFGAAAAVSPLPHGSFNGYWGQLGSDNVADYCRTGVPTVTVGFVNNAPEADKNTGYPGTNFAGHCWGTYYMKNGKQSQLLKDCPTMVQGIKECRDMGVKVILSIGGVYDSNSNYIVSTAANGRSFADFLWSAFGPYDPKWTGPRPMDGPDYHNTIDGFDFDLEYTVEQMQSQKISNDPYIAMVEQFRKHKPDMYISAAPQCPTADAWFPLKSLIQKAQFDALNIQFYNNPSCNFSPSNVQSNYDDWTKILDRSDKSKNAKIFVTLPASPQAASNGYIPVAKMREVVCKNSAKKHWGGLGVWELSWGATNVINGHTYAEHCLQALRDGGCGPEQPFPTTTTSKPVTTSTSIKTTTSKPVTTSTSIKTTTSSTSSTPVTTTTTTSEKPVTTTTTTSEEPVTTTTTTSEEPVTTTTTTSEEPVTTTTSEEPVTTTTSEEPVTTTTSEKPVTTTTTCEEPITTTTSEEPVTTTTSEEPVTTTTSEEPVTTTTSEEPVTTTTSEEPVTTTTSEEPVTTTTSEEPVTTTTSKEPITTTTSEEPVTTTTSEEPVTTTTSEEPVTTTTSEEPVTTTTSEEPVTTTTSEEPVTTTTSEEPVTTTTSEEPVTTTTSEEPVTTTTSEEPVTTTTSEEPVTTTTTSEEPVTTTTSEKPVTTSTEGPVTTSSVVPVTTSTAIWHNTTHSTGPTSSESVILTTSIVYTTSVHTVTACPPQVTNCPTGHVTTETIPLYTTICPVTATHKPPKPTSKPATKTRAPWTTSTVFTTHTYTVTACPPEVTNCPTGHVTTETVPWYTTICPVTETEEPTTTTTATSTSTRTVTISRVSSAKPETSSIESYTSIHTVEVVPTPPSSSVVEETTAQTPEATQPASTGGSGCTGPECPSGVAVPTNSWTGTPGGPSETLPPVTAGASGLTVGFAGIIAMAMLAQ